jgi:putative transposase
MARVCRALTISDHTYDRWLKEYGRMKLEKARRLKYLEGENACLKRLPGRRRAGQVDPQAGRLGKI